MRDNLVRTMTGSQGRYSAYLLRLWQTASGGVLVCRASIEDAHSTERLGFGNLDELIDYLRAITGQVPHTVLSKDNGVPYEMETRQSHKGGENEEE